MNLNSMGIRGVAARRWGLTFGFFSTTATYDCGDCGRLNQSQKTVPGNLRSRGVQLIMSQCKWCGELNTFWNGTKVQLFE